MAKQVDGDWLSLEGGADAGGVCGVPGEHVLNPVDTEPPAFHIREDQSSIATWRLTKPALQDGYRGLCQRGAAFLPTLSDHANVCPVPRTKSSRVAEVISESRSPVPNRLRAVMSDVPGEKASGLIDPRINSRFSQSPAIFKPAFIIGNQGLCVCLCKAPCRLRQWPLRVNQTSQLNQAVRAPRSPSSAVLRHPTVRTAVLAKPPSHVHHNVRGLNRFDRNTAFVKLIKKLPTGRKEMFDGMICVAGSFEALTKLV